MLNYLHNLKITQKLSSNQRLEILRAHKPHSSLSANGEACFSSRLTIYAALLTFWQAGGASALWSAASLRAVGGFTATCSSQWNRIGGCVGGAV